MTAQERAELASMYERNPEAAVHTIERLENKIKELEAQLSEKNYLLTGYEYTIQQQGFEIERLKAQLSKDREGINHIYKTEKK